MRYYMLRETKTDDPDQKIKSFNRAIKSLVLDISDQTIILRIALPKTSVGNELFKTQEISIREYLGLKYSHYIFSAPQKEGNHFWIKATHK